MKQTQTILFAMMMIALVSGCKKEDDTTPPTTTTTAKIKTYNWDEGNGERRETFAYDSQGRLTSHGQTANGTTYTTNYAYGTNFIVRSSGGGQDTIHLNSRGYEDGISYDADGHSLFNDGTIIYTWSGGNLASDGLSTYTYTDKTNTIGDENKGMFWKGKQSKNLAATRTIGSTTTYVYTYDSQNRVTAVSGNGTASYTYF